MSDHSCSCGGSCGCGGEAHHGHHEILTREEYVSRLELYLEDLKAEIEAVENELAQLRQQAVG